MPLQCSFDQDPDLEGRTLSRYLLIREIIIVDENRSVSYDTTSLTGAWFMGDL